MSQELHQEFIYNAISLIAQKLQNQGDQLFDEVSAKQFRLLRELYQLDYPLSLVELANWLGTSRQNTKSLINNLEHKGYVKVEPSELDKRSLQICLSAKGKRFVSQSEDMYTNYISILFKGFSSKELAQSARFMQELSDSIDSLNDLSDNRS